MHVEKRIVIHELTLWQGQPEMLRNQRFRAYLWYNYLRVFCRDQIQEKLL